MPTIQNCEATSLCMIRSRIRDREACSKVIKFLRQWIRDNKSKIRSRKQGNNVWLEPKAALDALNAFLTKKPEYAEALEEALRYVEQRVSTSYPNP